MFLHILNYLIAICVIRGKRIPWSVAPPSALKAARATAWNQYKNLRSRLGRHSEVVGVALGEFGRIIIFVIMLEIVVLSMSSS